jgi:hypothetical protein
MSSAEAARRAAGAVPEVALHAAVAAEVARRAAVPMSGPAPGTAGAKVSAARAEASRRNGARSRGPTTAEGKARAARNALKHGLCAEKVLMLSHEDPADLAALERALIAELAPAGAIQAVLARQVVSAAWRLHRADRLAA